MKLRRCHIPFLSSILHNINLDIAKYGLHQATNNQFRYRHCSIIPKGLNPKLLNILKSQRVIFVANHPHIIEPFVLIDTLPPRNDTYIVMNAKFLNWLSNLNKHIIPVHIQHHYKKENRLGLRARVFNLLPLSEKSMNQNKAHQLNIQNVNRASSLIDKGGMVMIFPGEENIHWFSGIGYLIKNTKTDEPIYLIRAFIRGTNKLDILSLLPGISKLFKSITIDYAPVIKINNLRKYDGKEIASIMENEYRKWKLNFQSLALQS